MKLLGLDIVRLRHASFKLSNGLTIYIDPYNISEDKADLILVSHEHFDHCSPNDIAKLVKDDTVIVAPELAASQLGDYNVQVVKPGDKIEVLGVKIEAVHAYNEKKPHHFRGKGVGFLLTLESVRVYFAGDTDFVGEMRELTGKVDIALLPVSGEYTMNAEEAAEACNAIKPKYAIPMHYGSIVGTDDDALHFKELVVNSDVRIV